jgi:hypothetical protein
VRPDVGVRRDIASWSSDAPECGGAILVLVSWQQVAVFSVALMLTAGCAEHLRSMDHAASWSTGVLFWPPPIATATWIAEPSAASTLGDAARLIDGTLRHAGHAEQRWFPIGARYEHGFAVTTRLERIDEAGASNAAIERWLSQYPDAASLRWLAGSADPYLPGPGRYRVMLVAFTDLAASLPGRPQRWDESTAMEGPELRATELPLKRRAPADYRVCLYIYEYEAKAADGAGRLVSPDTNLPASAHPERSGLSPLIPQRR